MASLQNKFLVAFTALCVTAVSFIGGVYVGVHAVETRLEHFADAHARFQGFDEVYPNHNVAAQPGKPIVVVVGDSISTSHYWPHATNGEFPFLLAKSLHGGLLNLAVPGWETDAMIAHAVPLIPPDSSIVIYEGGTNDLIYSGRAALPRINAVVSAVRRRAPRARIIMVGVRNFRKSLTRNIIEWNEHEAEVARATGSLYVDLYSLFGANDRVDWPDGVHPSNKGAQRIASAIKNALNGI